MSDIGIINATNNLTAMLYLCVCLGIMMIFFFALLIKKAVEKTHYLNTDLKIREWLIF